MRQVERLPDMPRSLYREVATAEEAHRIYGIGEGYRSTDETLMKVGYLPNRKSGVLGQPSWVAWKAEWPESEGVLIRPWLLARRRGPALYVQAEKADC